MKNIVIAVTALLLTFSPASASCVGTNSFSSCYDDSGNSYTVHRSGNNTMIFGNNARTGKSWSQNSYSSGVGSSFNSGIDGDGNSWSTTCTGGYCN